jgi:hypothetical protein
MFYSSIKYPLMLKKVQYFPSKLIKECRAAEHKAGGRLTEGEGRLRSNMLEAACTKCEAPLFLKVQKSVRVSNIKCKNS